MDRIIRWCCHMFLISTAWENKGYFFCRMVSLFLSQLSVLDLSLRLMSALCFCQNEIQNSYQAWKITFNVTQK